MGRRFGLRVQVEQRSLKTPVRITGYTFSQIELIVVELRCERGMGRGEAAGVYYRRDGIASMTQQIEAVRETVEAGITRDDLQKLLPGGGARNALDCALWELEAVIEGRPVWQLAGLEEPKPVVTTYTLSADDPETMARSAQVYAAARAIKLKLTGDAADKDRVRAVRAARPDVWLGVDANQGFTRATLEQLLPTLLEADVKLIEQPLAIGSESQLDGLRAPIPIAADESVQGLSDLPALVGRFDMANIKLDKCGGLTEALAMARAARKLGLGAMVGNMGGTSLATAPGFLVAQLCELADLDGPLILSADRAPRVVYEHGKLWCPLDVWGSGRA